MSIKDKLDNITKRIRYKSTVPYLPENQGIDIKVFENSELSIQYYLDMTHCVTKSK